LLGHSFGGGIALMTAINLVRANNPILPKGIVLLDALVYKTEMPFFVNYVRIPIIGILMLNLLSAEYQAEYTLNNIFYNKSKVTPEKISRYSYLIKLDGYDDAVIQTANQIIPENFEKYTDYYRYFNIDTLILWGRQDSSLPLESGIKLSQELKNSKLVIIEECGHNPQEEQPLIVADQVIKFIKQTEK